ncbi:MAG TPA: universal stress protein [Phycisphaerae bacterium]|nr:universal stress protein [Phycisphaerae bacterium]
MASNPMLAAVERYLAAQMQCESAARNLSQCALDEARLQTAHDELRRQNSNAGDAGLRRILVAVDRPNHPALHAALNLATPLRAQLAIVHVLEPLPAPNIDTAANAADLDQAGRADAHALMSALEHEIPPNALAFTVLRHGPAASEILAAAADFNADLIIMGAHRRGALARFFLGSVSAGVLRHARCPVMLILDAPPAAAPASPAPKTLQNA